MIHWLLILWKEQVLVSLSKAIILVDRGKGEPDTIEVLFNPNQYTIKSTNKFNMHTIPGLDAPVAQFIGGEAKTLDMKLFFDTYEAGTDVREHTSKITELQDIVSKLAVPPLCTFVWGNMQFQSIVTVVTENFTMFLASGIPVRATLDITFVEVSGVKGKKSSKASQSADKKKQIIIKENERLDTIANKEYNDPKKWRPISKANNIDNPRITKAGTRMTIPR